MRWQTLYEGRWIFLVLFLVAIGAFFLHPVAVVVPGLLIWFSISFFRDPERAISSDPAVIVSPADGVVTHVEENATIPSTGGTGRRVSIFLSVFNVHVNRAPVAGKILASDYQRGLFLDARDPDAHRKNESLTWVFDAMGRNQKVVVRQITGAIARRIVAWSKIGDTVEKGFRFGMIRFGSRTDLFLPMNTEICVRPGDKVNGGSTKIAVWKA